MAVQNTDPTKPWAPQERLINLLVTAILEQPNSATNLIDNLFLAWTDEERRTIADTLYRHVLVRIERVAMDYTTTKLPGAFSKYLDAAIQRALKESGIEEQVRARTEEYVRAAAARQLENAEIRADASVRHAVDSVLSHLDDREVRALLRDMLLRREEMQRDGK